MHTFIHCLQYHSTFCQNPSFSNSEWNPSLPKSSTSWFQSFHIETVSKTVVTSKLNFPLDFDNDFILDDRPWLVVPCHMAMPCHTYGLNIEMAVKILVSNMINTWKIVASSIKHSWWLVEDYPPSASKWSSDAAPCIHYVKYHSCIRNIISIHDLGAEISQ